MQFGMGWWWWWWVEGGRGGYEPISLPHLRMSLRVVIPPIHEQHGVQLERVALHIAHDAVCTLRETSSAIIAWSCQLTKGAPSTQSLRRDIHTTLCDVYECTLAVAPVQAFTPRL